MVNYIKNTPTNSGALIHLTMHSEFDPAILRKIFKTISKKIPILPVNFKNLLSPLKPHKGRAQIHCAMVDNAR